MSDPVVPLDHPRFHAAELAVFTRRVVADCMTHRCAMHETKTEKLDACCQYGCDVDLFERDAILARAANIKPVLRAEVREEYLKLIRSRRSGWRRTPRTTLIACADLIDIGDYDAAFSRLRSLLWLRRRWRISALFQILRIGQCSDAYWKRCLPYARSLRAILEAELARGRNDDRITKYALCSLFITRGFLRDFKNATDSPLIRDAAARLEHTVAGLLADERNWDAC